MFLLWEDGKQDGEPTLSEMWFTMTSCEYCRMASCNEGSVCGNRTMAQAMGDANKLGELPRVSIENVQHLKHTTNIFSSDFSRGVQPIVDKETMDKISKNFDDNVKTYMESQLKQNMTAFCATKPHIDLNIEKLREAIGLVQRETHFYIVECGHLPDNCKGIIYLRKEDADKLSKK